MMRSKIGIFLLFFTVSACAFGLGIYPFMSNPFTTLAQKPLVAADFANLPELYKKLEDNHDRALLAIKNDFSIDEESWNYFIQDMEQIKQDNSLIASTPDSKILKILNQEAGKNISALLQKIPQILAEYKINPDIILIDIKPIARSSAQAIQMFDETEKLIHKIELDPVRLAKHRLDMQEGLFRHELMHLLHFDSIEGTLISALLKHLGYEREQFTMHSSIIAYRHQKETRADILACLNHPEIAKGLQDYFAKFFDLMDQNDSRLWAWHPSDKMRHEQLMPLATQIT